MNRESYETTLDDAACIYLLIGIIHTALLVLPYSVALSVSVGYSLQETLLPMGDWVQATYWLTLLGVAWELSLIGDRRVSEVSSDMHTQNKTVSHLARETQLLNAVIQGFNASVTPPTTLVQMSQRRLLYGKGTYEVYLIAPKPYEVCSHGESSVTHPVTEFDTTYVWFLYVGAW